MDLNQPTPGPVDEAWVPQTCTLPTAERPVRVAEFDQLFADSVTGVDTVGPGRIRMRLRPDRRPRPRPPGSRLARRRAVRSSPSH